MNDGFWLQVRSEDLSMLAEIYEEGIACPPPFDLDDFEGNVAE